jgi:hypothetical protein
VLSFASEHRKLTALQITLIWIWGYGQKAVLQSFSISTQKYLVFVSLHTHHYVVCIVVASFLDRPSIEQWPKQLFSSPSTILLLSRDELFLTVINHPIKPPKVRFSSFLANATHPRQSQIKVPPALLPLLQGIVWCNSSFQSLSVVSLLHL